MSEKICSPNSRRLATITLDSDATAYGVFADSSNAGKRLGVLCGGELRGGVNPRRDRRKLDNCVTRAMRVAMKLVRVASNRHLRNWEAPDALVQEITPSGVMNG